MIFLKILAVLFAVVVFFVTFLLCHEPVVEKYDYDEGEID